SANKKQELIKSDDKKEDTKVDEKKRDMNKVKCYNCKKEGHFTKDCKKAKVKDYNYYKTKMLLAKKDSDEQMLLAEDKLGWNPVILIRKSMQTWSSWLKLKRFFQIQTKVLHLLKKPLLSLKCLIVCGIFVRVKMSRDVITVGSTMRIPLLYQGEYSQWRERFMNYLEEQTDGEAMINSIRNGDQPLPVIALAGTAQNTPPTLKDLKFWTAEEKKTRKIDSLARSLLIQGLPNDIYSLIDSNETAKDLWDALERQMRGSEYGEQDRKAAILYEYETFKAIEGEQLLDTYLCYLQVINDLKKCGYKKDNYPLALVAKKTNVSKQKEKVVVSSDSEGSGTDDFSELKKIIDLLAKAFNRRKFYSKPTNNNLRTSSASQSANKKQEFVKTDDKKADEKKRDMSKEINANMVFMAQIEKVLLESNESSSSAEETIAEVAYYKGIFHDAIEFATEKFIENHIDSQKDYDKFEVDHNDSEEKEHLVDKLIQKFNHKIAKLNIFEKQNNELNEQIKVLNEKNVDLLAQTKVLKDQLQVKHVVIDTHVECHEKYAKLEEDRYEYMIRYSTLFDNDKQHRKQIADQEVLFDKMSVQLTVHMIMPSKDNLYNGRKGIGFENSSYFEKAKDLRPMLYDEKVIGLRYTLMFLTHSNEALEIEKFKRSRENKIEFAYDYRNLNASYVNEKINFRMIIFKR
nr:hypothetical protein [Tanacetum cinerariifolium]